MISKQGFRLFNTMSSTRICKPESLVPNFMDYEKQTEASWMWERGARMKTEWFVNFDNEVWKYMVVECGHRTPILWLLKKLKSSQSPNDHELRRNRTSLLSIKVNKTRNCPKFVPTCCWKMIFLPSYPYHNRQGILDWD